MDPMTQAIIERYYASLYRLAYSTCQNQADAEDAVQDAFERYLRRAPEFAEESQRRAWLMTVTVNRCRDLLRRRRNHVPLDEQIPAQAPECYPELTQALGLLHARDRTILYLTYYEQLTSQEVGQILHMPAASVRTRLARAREKLKSMLGEEFYNA